MKKDTSNDPTHIYYDLTLTNFSSTTSGNIPIEFREARNSPFVSKAKDYYLSVVRFQIDSYGLPSYMANIQPNQNNRDLMIESVTLEADIAGVKTAYQTFLQWIPRNESAKIPVPPNQTETGFQDLSTDYYFGNHFGYFCDLVNIALGQSYLALKTAHAATFPSPPNLPPFLYWNSDSLKAVMYANEAEFNPSQVNRINIYFNRPLYAFFNSFKSIANTTTATSGRNYLLLMDTDQYNGKNQETINSSVYIKLEQDWSTIANWTPVASVVFTSSTLPIVPSQQSAPLVYNEGQLLTNSNNSNFARILTDIASNDLVYKPNLLYVPSAEYRFVDLTTDSPINNIDVQVFWKDRFGILRPMYLLSGISCTMKIMFQKKGQEL